MLPTKVIFFLDDNKNIPFLNWWDALNLKSRMKCRLRLIRLACLGHELRRPEADYLRDGIYELRIGLRGRNYRILYFFAGTSTVVVSHGIIKEQKIPPEEIDLAIHRKLIFLESPDNHSFEEFDLWHES